jgi:hypothetical protein
MAEIGREVAQNQPKLLGKEAVLGKIHSFSHDCYRFAPKRDDWAPVYRLKSLKCTFRMSLYWTYVDVHRGRGGEGVSPNVDKCGHQGEGLKTGFCGRHKWSINKIINHKCHK